MHLPRPITFRLAQMFDISTWMKTCRETLHEHVHAHCFKFTKKDSKVVMYYRKWSCDNCMGPVTILKVTDKFSFSPIYRRLRNQLFQKKKLNRLMVTFSNYFQGWKAWWCTTLSGLHVFKTRRWRTEERHSEVLWSYALEEARILGKNSPKSREPNAARFIWTMASD